MSSEANGVLKKSTNRPRQDPIEDGETKYTDPESMVWFSNEVDTRGGGGGGGVLYIPSENQTNSAHPIHWFFVCDLSKSMVRNNMIHMNEMVSPFIRGLRQQDKFTVIQAFGSGKFVRESGQGPNIDYQLEEPIGHPTYTPGNCNLGEVAAFVHHVMTTDEDIKKGAYQPVEVLFTDGLIDEGLTNPYDLQRQKKKYHQDFVWENPQAKTPALWGCSVGSNGSPALVEIMTKGLEFSLYSELGTMSNFSGKLEKIKRGVLEIMMTKSTVFMVRQEHERNLYDERRMWINTQESHLIYFSSRPRNMNEIKEVPCSIMVEMMKLHDAVKSNKAMTMTHAELKQRAEDLQNPISECIRKDCKLFVVYEKYRCNLVVNLQQINDMKIKHNFHLENNRQDLKDTNVDPPLHANDIDITNPEKDVDYLLNSFSGEDVQENPVKRRHKVKFDKLKPDLPRQKYFFAEFDMGTFITDESPKPGLTEDASQKKRHVFNALSRTIHKHPRQRSRRRRRARSRSRSASRSCSPTRPKPSLLDPSFVDDIDIEMATSTGLNWHI